MSAPARRRGKAETSPSRVRHAERQARALALRIEGRSSVQIAEELGISRGTAWRLVSGALKDRRQEIAERTEELRALEHERIEGYIAQLRPLALGGNLAAHRALLRWHERLARLLALDLERKIEGEEPLIFVVDMNLPADRAGGADEVIEIAEVGEFEEVDQPALKAGEQARADADPGVEPLDGSS